MFIRLCYGLLLLLMTQLYVSYFLTGYAMNLTMLENSHQSANLMMILCVAPLQYLFHKDTRLKWFAVATLLGVWGALFISQVRTGVILPLFLCAIAALLGVARKRIFAATVITVFVVAALFIQIYPQKLIELTQKHESVYYRFESYFFSLHVVRKHPWLGIGLRTPRLEYLHDYTIKTKGLKLPRFKKSLQRTVTGENIFLTFMTGLGIPFTVIYTVSLLTVIILLLRQVRRKLPFRYFHPLVLMFPICAVFLHMLVDDGLMHPETSYLFHLLLGLVPIGSSPLKPIANEELEDKT